MATPEFPVCYGTQLQTSKFTNSRFANARMHYIGGHLRIRAKSSRDFTKRINLVRQSSGGFSTVCSHGFDRLKIKASSSNSALTSSELESPVDGVASSSSELESPVDGVASTLHVDKQPSNHEAAEEMIEKAIFNCRFLTLLAVAGSLAGSLLCFLKGCSYVFQSFQEYFRSYLSTHGSGKVILLLVEAIDVYLMGTVMLIFGMGLYELFVNSLEIPDRASPGPSTSRATVCGSNLFGLFRLQERPKWLEIQSLDELKTKLGHVIVMVLLVGMFEKSKKVPINSGVDLLCFSGSVLFASGGLFLLSKLNFGK